MNAKRLMLLASVMMLAGCIEEIPVEFGSRPQLVMNANLMSGRTDHKVYLTVGTEDGFVPPASDSRILCYVDDELVAEALQEESSEYREHCLVFDLHADFKAGDHVRLVAESGDINVTGMIETCVEIKANINAFSYEGTVEGSTVWYYTTLKTAIDNGQTDIEALGTTSVLESVDIPAETTVKAGKTHDKITIGSTDARDVVVTVKDGGEIRSCIIDVMGTLTFDNKRNDRGNTITSDVYVEDDVSKSYTNIYTALNNAQSGETVTIYRSGSNVVLDKDVTIKTGVTLDIPSGKGITVNDTVTVTVDGTLKLSGNLVAQNVGFNPDVDNHSTIDVNGAFMAVGEIVYADDVVSTVDYYIPGAYYNLVNTSGNWNYVTPIEQAAAVSNDVTGGEIEIWGENQVGDVAFTGDEDVEVTIDLYGKLNASNIKLTYSTFNVGAGYQFDGTVSSDAGSVQIVNASNFVVGSTVDEDAATIMSISGTPTQVDDKGADAKVTVATGNVSVLNANADGNDFVVTGVEFAISEGATLTVAESNAVLDADELAVNGTLVATNGGKVVAEKVYIIGTFTVAVADNDNGVLAGSADVKEVRVGLSSDFETTSAATLNAEKLNGWTAITCPPPSSTSRTHSGSPSTATETTSPPSHPESSPPRMSSWSSGPESTPTTSQSPSTEGRASSSVLSTGMMPRSSTTSMMPTASPPSSNVWSVSITDASLSRNCTRRSYQVNCARRTHPL